MREQEHPRKFAFVGAGGVGKTTIIDALKNIHANDQSVVFVEEAARLYFRKNPNISDRFSVGPQGKIQALALEKEQLAHAQYPKLIFTDRAVIDAVVYTRANGDKEGAEQLLKGIDYWLPTYNKFFLPSPDGIPFVNDTERKEEEAVRTRLHSEFVAFFVQTGLPVTVLIGTLNQRIKQVLAEINKP